MIFDFYDETTFSNILKIMIQWLISYLAVFNAKQIDIL